MEKKHSLYFVQEHLQKTVFHGGVGNVDIERILLDNGFKAINFPFHYEFSLRAKYHRYAYLVKLFFSLPGDAILFFQFPLYARIHKLLISLLRFRSSIRVICLVADINGLKDGNEMELKKEISMLKQFRYFIVHGEPMDRWLKEQVGHATTSRLYFFDFLTAETDAHRNKTGVVAFAGNLEKSPFIHQLNRVAEVNKSLQFNIYGPGARQMKFNNPSIKFKGVFDPYQLPAILEGSFGLVWDGEAIEKAGGNLGAYMQYISHHKLSLYILAGLPIIAYDKAGSAAMIKKLNIGFTVNSIFEIGEQINMLTEPEYQLMRKNMHPLALRISSGQHLTTALNELLNLMKKRGDKKRES